ncbi:Molybdenum transport system permease protein ModB (TC 3.A.1.8.1) [Citrobacter freundii]|uniref:Molybdenum transport system permease protein ModB (TC 3.A.1.8.1) n=1 Tax=Citrobacter freundii TaxID=546 RepID=A0A7G2IMK4_CITFR|nr:Molybdenum transport system permease protein ModB (TC 3.A.1.8.1) [Citrobacter freundii]
MILTDPEWQAVILSLKVSSLAVLFSLPFGIFFAWLLVRCKFPGKALLDSVLHLPLVLPPVVVGYLLLVSMGRRGFIGEWLYDWFGITFAFSWRGAVLAAAVMSFPLMVRAIRLALEGVDVKLEQAARTLGAGRWRVFYDHYVTADAARHYCWYGAGVCAFPWGIRRNHYLCFQHSW